MARSKSIKGKKLQPRKLRQVLLKSLAAQPKKRLNAKQLIKKLKIANTRKSVEDALANLARDGKVTLVKDQKYRIARDVRTAVQSQSIKSYEGYVDLTRSGSAYIICDELDQDVYVPARRTKQAKQGDRVRVELGKRYGKRLEGTIVEIIEHSTDQFVGTFRWSRNFGFVVPENQLIPFDIFVHPDHQGGAQEDDMVLVEILTWADQHRKSPSGKVVRIFDPEDQHEIQVESILSDHGFRMTFPVHVDREAHDLPRKISQQEISRRKDLRKVPTFTIDPLTAKDFDDAISVYELEDGNVEVGIHIADVTHYVKPGSAIDQEAFRRATSVYLVDRTAPMLPEVLSNELCSLRPHEDSLTFSAVFQFDKSHRIRKRWFGKTIIHSDHRFTYEEAQEVLNEGTGKLHSELSRVAGIARKLRRKRLKHGGITFETPEFQFELDKEKKPIAIHSKIRQETNMLIEDLMLLANKEVALYISRKATPEIPLVYRVHDQPDPDKLSEYALLLKELGFKFDFQSPPRIRASFAALHQAAKSDEALAFAERSAVRTMAKAVYSPDNIGHFGLGFSHYAHFTSPIRRYADVIVHRILELNLRGEFRAAKEDLETRCRHISNQERKATEAERASVKYKQVEFIAQYIGKSFPGFISGFIERGMFVTLQNNGVEGLLGYDQFDSVFEVPEHRLKAMSKKTGEVFRMGDQIDVVVLDVRLEDAEVDFALVT